MVLHQYVNVNRKIGFVFLFPLTSLEKIVKLSGENFKLIPTITPLVLHSLKLTKPLLSNWGDNMHRLIMLSLIAMVLCASSTSAQIVITAREVPSAVGSQFQYYSQSGDSIPVNVGFPGGPQTWDYTEGDTSFVSTDLYLDPAVSPPQYSRANVVIQTDQLNLAGLTEPGKMYCYLHHSRFILGAIETTYEGTTVDFMFSPYVNQYALPLQMGSSWTNTINLDEVFEFPDYDIRIELYATMDGQVDAYGTVSVPQGDFEALRIRNDVYYDLTVSIRFLWVWVPIYEDTGEAINYDWRAEDVGTILTITGETNDPYFSYAQSIRRLMSSSTSAVEGQPLASIPVEMPLSFNLIGSYPNPFNNETIISYQLPTPAEVDLRVFDVMGRQVAVLFQGHNEEGVHEITWSPENQAAGVYFVQLRAGEQLQQKMMVYLK